MNRQRQIQLFSSLLDQHTLDPTFEAYGNFVLPHNGNFLLWGNFLDYSHVFRIEFKPNEPEFLNLVDKIRRNQRGLKYLANKQHREKRSVPEIISQMKGLLGELEAQTV